jgi:transposase InsO family protein
LANGTAAAFWLRAQAWFAEAGITVSAQALGPMIHKWTRPYRPPTNGTVERYHRTLADAWAYARTYHTDTERCAAFIDWLSAVNHPPAASLTSQVNTVSRWPRERAIALLHPQGCQSSDGCGQSGPSKDVAR